MSCKKSIWLKVVVFKMRYFEGEELSKGFDIKGVDLDQVVTLVLAGETCQVVLRNVLLWEPVA